MRAKILEAATGGEMMRAITGRTIAYLIVVAVMIWSNDSSSRLSGVILAEAVLSSPMIAAWLISRNMKSAQFLRIMLILEISYCAFSTLLVTLILAGEHDAQWQLAFLLIPVIGLPVVAVVGVFATLRDQRVRARR